MCVPWSEVDGKKIETHGSGENVSKNKTYGEALIICMQKRGVRIVEQRLLEVAQQEARLSLAKDADVVSTKDLANRVGRQLHLDTVYYADALSRRTHYEFSGKPFGANNVEAMARGQAATARQSITPDDAKRCHIVVHHSVGLTIRAVDVATGKITWVGYRNLSIAQEYDDNHPEVVTTFNSVQRLAECLAGDLLGERGNSDSARKKGA
jgi:hypothetical protein